MEEITLNLEMLCRVSIACIDSVGREILQGISIKDKETVSGCGLRCYTATNGQVCLREMELLENPELVNKELIINSKDLNLENKMDKMLFGIEKDTLVNVNYCNGKQGKIRLIKEKFPDNVENILDCGKEKPNKFFLFRSANLKIIEKFLDVNNKDIDSYGKIYYRQLSAYQNVIYFKKGQKVAAMIALKPKKETD